MFLFVFPFHEIENILLQCDSFDYSSVIGDLMIRESFGRPYGISVIRDWSIFNNVVTTPCHLLQSRVVWWHVCWIVACLALEVFHPGLLRYECYAAVFDFISSDLCCSMIVNLPFCDCIASLESS